MRPKVNWNLCLGCGLCAENCPLGVITLAWGKAWINQSRCVPCGQCIEICPQGAITEEIPVSVEALTDEVQSLRRQANDIIVRIENLRTVS